MVQVIIPTKSISLNRPSSIPVLNRGSLLSANLIAWWVYTGNLGIIPDFSGYNRHFLKTSGQKEQTLFQDLVPVLILEIN